MSFGATAEAAQNPVVGRYELYEEIASGGMAAVYLARLVGPVGFAKTVAVKRLYPQYAKDPSFVSMFLDEARLAARIRHPNVVPTIDVVVGQDELFLVMEYVQGEPLSKLLQRIVANGQRMPLAIATALMAQVLRGLDAAHEACDERGQPLSIVHRDVSPQNILVGVDGQARILDFGIAKARGRTQHTEEGQLKGKVPYMAPEQVACDCELTRAVDVYAASAVLWEMICGERLFPSESQAQLLLKVLRHEIRAPRSVRPDIPAALEEIILRGLSREPSERFATARDMALALERCHPPASVADVSEFVCAHAERESLELVRLRSDDATTGMTEAKRFVEQLKNRPTVVEVNRLPTTLPEEDAVITQVLAVTEVIPPPMRPRRSLSRRLLAGGALLLVGMGLGLCARGTPRLPVANADVQRENAAQPLLPRAKPNLPSEAHTLAAPQIADSPIMVQGTTSALRIGDDAFNKPDAAPAPRMKSKSRTLKLKSNRASAPEPALTAGTASPPVLKSTPRRQNDALFERD